MKISAFHAKYITIFFCWIVFIVFQILTMLVTLFRSMKPLSIVMVVKIHLQIVHLVMGLDPRLTRLMPMLPVKHVSTMCSCSSVWVVSCVWVVIHSFNNFQPCTHTEVFLFVFNISSSSLLLYFKYLLLLQHPLIERSELLAQQILLKELQNCIPVRVDGVQYVLISGVTQRLMCSVSHWDILVV